MKNWYLNSAHKEKSYRVDWLHPLTNQREIYARNLSNFDARKLSNAVSGIYAPLWFGKRAETIVAPDVDVTNLTQIEYINQLKSTLAKNPGDYRFEWHLILKHDSHSLYDVDSYLARRKMPEIRTAFELGDNLGAITSKSYKQIMHADLADALLDYDLRIYDMLMFVGIGYYQDGTFFFKTEAPKTTGIPVV